jgi:hypothetical protein
MTGTNATRDPDSVLAAWLDEGPTDLPDATRRAILTALPTTPQARGGPFATRTSPQMTLFARGAGLLVAAVVVIGVVAFAIGPRGNTGGPGTSPSKSLEPSGAASQPPLPTLDATFVSPTYGYQVDYPTGWTVTRAAAQWSVNSSFRPGNPVADSIVTPGGTYRMRISGASVVLPAGTTMEAFRQWASPLSSPFNPNACTPVSPLQGPVLINYRDPGKGLQKVAAVVSVNGCLALADLGGNVYDVEVIAGGRGYDFVFDGNLSATDALAWLASITLDPATAAAASATPTPS